MKNNLEISKNINELIKKYDKIFISGHINPDGDCVSSVRALKFLIENNYTNKKVYALGSIPLNLINLVSKSDEVSEIDFKDGLAIFVDLNDLNRVEDKRIFLSKKVVIIDHHIFNTNLDFLDTYYLIEDAPSATFVIYDLIKKLNLKINDLIAYYLYIGLITDSKRFLLSSNKETFEVSKELVSYNFDVYKIYKEINRINEKIIKFRVYAYTHYKFSKKICYLVVNKEVYLSLGLKQNDISEEISLLNNLNYYPYWIFFLENLDGRVRVEFRCIETKNVQIIAKRFGGGGHKCASGCTLNNLNEVNEVIDYIDNFED